MLLEFHDAATGDPDAFALMIDWCEKNQSKVILGGTLTSGADGKSSTNALGNVHNEVRKDLRDSDVRQVNSTVTRDLVYAIAAVNGLAPEGVRRAPQFRLNAQEPEDMKAFADSLPKLISIGVRPTVQWAHEKLGIPMAEKDEPVLGAPPAPAPSPDPNKAPPPGAPAPSPEPPPGRAAAAAQLPAVQRTVPPVQMQQQLARSMAPAVDGWVDQVRDLVMRAGSLAEIRDGLHELLPGMSLDQYAGAMAEAMSVAYLAGRYEVLQEAGALRG